MPSPVARWSTALFAAAAQSVLILALPTAAFSAAGYGFGFGLFAAIGVAGMVALAILDTPRRLHAIAHELTAPHDPRGPWMANIAAWSAALPGAAVGGLVSAALWWGAAAIAGLATVGAREFPIMLVLGFGVVPSAAFVRAGYLASRAIGVTTGRRWFAIIDVGFATLGLGVGLAVTALIAGPLFVVLFVVSASVRGTI